MGRAGPQSVEHVVLTCLREGGDEQGLHVLCSYARTQPRNGVRRVYVTVNGHCVDGRTQKLSL